MNRKGTCAAAWACNSFRDRNPFVRRLDGAAPRDAQRGQGAIAVRRFWIVLDPTLRVLELVHFAADGSDISRVLACLETLPPPDRFAGIELQAPILYLPNVFEADLCRHLIELHERNASEDSPYMREVDGKTVRAMDRSFKRRKDCHVEEPELMALINARIVRRICPEVMKVHRVTATHIERYTIGCSSDDGGGHFLPHRDDTSKGTAHRQFAVSINLKCRFRRRAAALFRIRAEGLQAADRGRRRILLFLASRSDQGDERSSLCLPSLCLR